MMYYTSNEIEIAVTPFAKSCLFLLSCDYSSIKFLKNSHNPDADLCPKTKFYRGMCVIAKFAVYREIC